eukprot:jgi/Bigna1/87053/estExt_fgenesh1_pg.C_160123
MSQPPSSSSSSSANPKPSNQISAPPSYVRNFRDVAGGLNALATRYGEQNNAENFRKRQEQEIESMEDFTLPMGWPREDFEYNTAGAEEISTKTHISSKNKGYQLLMKMGWTKGQGCGKSSQGITEPVVLKVQEHGMSVGIGKDREYEEQAEAATANRRLLLVEKNETAEEVKARTEQAMKVEEKREHVREIQKVFLCKDCDKQYTNIQQYEEHCNSYDHHHRVRIREMKRQHQQRKMMAGKSRKKAAKSRQDRLFAERIAKAQALAQKGNKGANTAEKGSLSSETSSTAVPKQQPQQQQPEDNTHKKRMCTHRMYSLSSWCIYMLAGGSSTNNGKESGMQGTTKVAMSFGMKKGKSFGMKKGKRKAIGFSMSFGKKRR